MSGAAALPAGAPAAARPAVRFYDARRLGVDERGLRELVRARCRESGAAHFSRSYRYPFAVAAWHSLPLGVDLERVEQFGRPFAESIATPLELARIERVGRPDDAWIASLWSGKEAVAKAYGDAVDYDPRRLDSPLTWPDGEAGRWRAVPLAAPLGHRGWVCWRAE